MFQAFDRILVIRLGALGDVVRTLPAALGVRRRCGGSHLAWLVEPRAAGALRARAWLDEVIEFPRERIEAAWRGRRLSAATRTLVDFARDLRRRRFDLVLDFHATLKSAALARLSGATTRVGYAPPAGREGSWLLASERVAPPPPPLPRFERNAALARWLGAEPAVEPTALEPAPAAVKAIAEALSSRSAPVLLHPGSSAGAAHKRWSTAGLAAVARELARRADARSLVLWGPAAGEQDLAERVVSLAGGSAELAPDTSDFERLAALAARARLFVGGDSGPLHVASLVGTPVVQILGPTHPIENRPWPHTAWRQVRVPVACSPCRRGCAAATCLRVVTPEQVCEASLELLGEGARLAASSASGSG